MERYDDEPPAASKNLHASIEPAPEMAEFVVHFHPHGLKDPCGRMYPLGTSRIKAGHQTRELIGRLYPLHGPLSHYGLGYGTGESFFAVFAKYPFKVFRGVLVYQVHTPKKSCLVSILMSSRASLMKLNPARPLRTDGKKLRGRAICRPPCFMRPSPSRTVLYVAVIFPYYDCPLSVRTENVFASSIASSSTSMATSLPEGDDASSILAECPAPPTCRQRKPRLFRNRDSATPQAASRRCG